MTDPLTLQKRLADSFNVAPSDRIQEPQESASQILNLFSDELKPVSPHSAASFDSMTETEALGHSKTVVDFDVLKERLSEESDQDVAVSDEKKVLHPFIIGGIMLTLAAIIVAGEYLL